jgi:PsbP-like protein
MNGRGIIPITIFIIALVVVDPAYAILGLPDNFNNDNSTNTAQSEQQPIGGFSTYKDSTSLFTIQYPSDWKPTGVKDGHVTFTSPFDFESGKHLSQMIIFVVDTNASTLNQLISQRKSTLEHMPIANSKIIDESQATLAGLPAHKIITDSTLSTTTIQFNSVDIFTLKSGKQYSVTYTVGQQEDLPIIQQMIDSFQITK